MANKTVAIILTVLFSFFLHAQEDELKQLEIEVPVNIEKILKLDFSPNSDERATKLANPSYVDIRIAPQKKEIMLVGLKAGETTLSIRDMNGDVKARYLIRVTASDQTKLVGQLRELLKDVEGLEIGIKGDKVFAGGQIVVPSDIGKVVVVLDGYPEVLRLVELSPHTQIIIAKKMQEELQRSNLKDVTVRVVNGQFWVEGIVNDQKEVEKVEQIVKAYLPDQIQNLARRTDSVQSTKKLPYEIMLTINSKPKPEPIPKLFKITSQFVELTKAYDKIFGFGWTPILSGGGGEINIGKTSNGGVSSTSSGALSATISNLFPKLNSAKSAGHARVIQSGIIVVKENIEGKIIKSTEIPYTVGTTVDNTRVGVARAEFKLSVTPTMLQEERINLKINMNVSALTGANSSTTLNNTIETQIVVKSQESAVLGGIVSNQTSTQFDKDPPEQLKVDGGVPLFSFLKSKNYSTNRSQFVIFVTPEIIESAATGVSEIERKFRKRSR